MWFAYMDESKENNQFFVYSALVMNGDKWNEAFSVMRYSADNRKMRVYNPIWSNRGDFKHLIHSTTGADVRHPPLREQRCGRRRVDYRPLSYLL
jgi:hypothetical protein